VDGHTTIEVPRQVAGLPDGVTHLAVSVGGNDIQRAAARHGLPVVDLRVVCSHPSDDANPIEPSSIGGEKIARSLAAALGVPPRPGAA
jgi:hypothetical protein